MSDVAIGRGVREDGAFNRGTMLLIAAVGVLAFVAMLVLGAYAPDLRSGRDGGAHALSKAATGYSAVVRLARATGRNPQIVRSRHQLGGDALAVLTPESAAADLTEILEIRGPRATLVVLPKWRTEKHELRPAWVRAQGLLPAFQPHGVLAPAIELQIARVRGQGRPLVTVPDHAPAELRFTEPAVYQSMTGKDLTPIIASRSGRLLLARVGNQPFYVLSDPDLLNNYGMDEPRRAAAALAMLDFLNSTGSGEIMFDVTLNGLGHSRSPLRLAFDPPFLAVTVAIFVALLLAGIQAAFRFGAPKRPERAIAFGKAALVDNAAALVRKAGREARLGQRYVDMIRERAAARFRIPPRLGREEVDERLDALDSRRPFSQVAGAAASANDRDELLRSARALHHWLEEVKT